MKNIALFALTTGLALNSLALSAVDFPIATLTNSCDTVPLTGAPRKAKASGARMSGSEIQTITITRNNIIREHIPDKYFAQDFNTTRSNRERGMGLVINIHNDGSVAGDRVPARHEAQDFNTTRSNRERGMGLVINIDNTGSVAGDSVPARQEAQDFNTTRSNRERGMGLVINIDNNSSVTGDSVPARHEAQDFNTTRSNRERGMGLVINIDNNGSVAGDSVPARHEAQDFNTTRSNRERGMGLVINIDNTGSVAGDSVPARHEAQDFNTTRSNRERGMGLVINIDNNGSVTGDSVPARHEAQDFNTTRSNRERGMGLVINIHNGDSGTDDDSSDNQKAQDHNSSRSNKSSSIDKGDGFDPIPQSGQRKAGTVDNPLYEGNGNSGDNPMFESKGAMKGIGGNGSGSQTGGGQKAQDHNSSRSNKSGIIVINIFSDAAQSGFNKSGGDRNPRYEDKGHSGTNPIFEGKGALKGSGGNGSGSQTPGGQKAQDHNSSRSNKSSVLLFDAGFSSGLSNYTVNGGNANLEYQIPLSRLFNMAAGAGFGFLGFNYGLPAALPEKIAGEMKESFTNKTWNFVTLSAGPVLNWGRHKLQAGIYGKAGVSFIRHPRQFIGVPDDHGVVTRENGLAEFGGSKTAFTVQTGARVSYAIDRRISLYLNPQMLFLTGKSITFSEKNISKAIENGGDFNFDVFRALPFDKKNESMSKIGLNLGVAMRLIP